MNKKETRKHYKALRDSLAPKEVLKRSEEIIDQILMLEEYKKCEKIFSYIDFNNEVHTTKLINKALDDGKIVAVPWVDKNEMYFIHIQSFDNLVRSNYGILEPVFDENRILKSDDKSIAIVPGLAFDKNNYRLGYGGGYYDKYFSKNSFMKKIGVCFNFQMLDILNVDEHDMTIDLVITDR